MLNSDPAKMRDKLNSYQGCGGVSRAINDLRRKIKSVNDDIKAAANENAAAPKIITADENDSADESSNSICIASLFEDENSGGESIANDSANNSASESSNGNFVAKEDPIIPEEQPDEPFSNENSDEEYTVSDDEDPNADEEDIHANESQIAIILPSIQIADSLEEKTKPNISNEEKADSLIQI
jgi:hypothetical protein